MIEFVIEGLKTPNPLNGATGNSKRAAIIRTKRRRQHRELAKLHALAAKPPELPVVVHVTRVAPSNGLDPHDGLGAALKGIIDGIADAFGVDDRDPRIRFVPLQERGPWGVKVKFTPVAINEVADAS